MMFQFVVIFIGLFTIAGGIFNWDWFMTNGKAQIPIMLLGRVGARILYIVMGIMIVGVGLNSF